MNKPNIEQIEKDQEKRRSVKEKKKSKKMKVSGARLKDLQKIISKK